MTQKTTRQTRERVSIDPITLEVIRHGIISICDQIDANMTRTAFSPYIYEYKDYAVGFVSTDGELLAQCTGGMPVFVADSVGMAVKDGLATYGREDLHKGDVVICNHAAVQGQHLNNTVMYTPVFAGPRGDDLIGFFAVNCHWIDIGGSAIGSVSYSSTDIFMEGLQLRSIKLWSKGEPIEEVYRIIENNTRFPQELLGDIEAQLGGCLLGRDLTQAMGDKYGTRIFLDALDTILDQCEAATREKIRAIPDGVYQHEAFLDNDGVRDETIPIKVKVIVQEDEMTIDYSEMSPQVRGCINSGFYGGGRTTARVAFKYLIATDEPANEGTFRPLKMILPEGKLISAEPKAAMGLYSIPFPTIIDCIIKALEPALPQRVTGAHFGTFSSLSFAGKRTDTGAFFKANDSGHGGWGACATHDGAGPFRTMAHGDTRLIPIELQESMYPFRVEEFRLRLANCGRTSTASAAHPGACKARKPRSQVKFWSSRTGNRNPSCFTKPKIAHCKPVIACACPPVAAAVMATRRSVRWSWSSATLSAAWSRPRAPAQITASSSTATVRPADYSTRFNVQG